MGKLTTAGREDMGQQRVRAPNLIRSSSFKVKSQILCFSFKRVA